MNLEILKQGKDMIIDSHIHLSIRNKKDNFDIAFDKLLSNLKKNDIGKAIVIADNVANYRCADTDFLLGYFKNYKDIFIVGSIYVFKYSKEDINKFDNLLEKREIIGLKIYCGHDKIYPTDKRFISTYKLCLKHDLPIIIHAGINTDDLDSAKYNDPKHVVKIADRYPNLKIIVAHYFWPRLDYGYKTTKGYKNICFDTSALGDKEVIKACGGVKKVKEVLEKTIMERPNSVIFGSDYPCCDMKNHVELIKSLNISDELKNRIFYKNALNLFNLNK